MVRSVANMSGMSNSDPAGEVDQHAEALVGTRPLADDGADDRQRHADPHATEDARQRRRDLEGRQHLTAGRTQRSTELEQAGVDRADADHRRDGDREEDDERADDDLAEQPRPEPERDQRRKREDRGRLGCHEVGRRQPFDDRASGERVARRRAPHPHRPRSRARPRPASRRDAAGWCRRTRPTPSV